MDQAEDKKIIPKIVCVLLSFTLWLYVSNVENSVRIYDIKNVPVELVNVDIIENNKFILVNDESALSVDLKVEGPSSEVSNIKKDNFKVIADLSQFALKEGENTIPVQIISYPENIVIKNNGFLGVTIDIEKYISKEVIITSDIKRTYGNNVYENSIEISPKTVVISGGKSSVDRVKSAVISGEERDIKTNISKDYPINFLDSAGNKVEGISSNIQVASMSVEVSNGKSVKVNVPIIGELPEGYILDRIELDKNYVTIMGNDQNLNSISEINTDSVDISNFTQDKQINLSLKVPNGFILKEDNSTISVKLIIVKQVPTTKEFKIKILYNNLPEGFQMTTDEEYINVAVSGLRKYFDNFDESSMEAKVDLSGIKDEGVYNFKPEVVLLKQKDKLTIGEIKDVNVSIKRKNEQQ